MIAKNGIRVAVIGLFCAALLWSGSSCRRESRIPRNVILFISDGCGFAHVDAASLYQFGRTGRQAYESFPVRLAMSTYPAGKQGYNPDEAWASFDYVKDGSTDSAASATAMATGVKTYNGAINWDVDGKPLRTFFETAEEKGKATGIVSSVMFSHATGACFAAHNPKRSNYVEIAREMIQESAVDVILGCGHPYYSTSGRKLRSSRFKFVGGEETWQSLLDGSAGGDADGDGRADPWILVQTRAEFQALAEGTTPRRVIGLPLIYQTLQQQRSGSAKAAPFEIPLLETVPTLVEMTEAALNILDDDPDGFYLMVEGGAVDWAAHSNQSGRVIEEQIDFNHAIEAVIAWVEKHGGWNETLVIVTADHETGYLNGRGSGPADPDNGGEPRWEPLGSNGRGKQPDMVWHIGGHTNMLVPFYAKGAGSRALEDVADQVDPVRGRYLDNSDIARVVFSFLQ
jgi:alkaline phosphatase